MFTISQVQRKKKYLIPNANGSNIDLSKFPNTGESNYEDIDDSILTPDEDSTYVYSTTSIFAYKTDYDRHGNETTYDCCSTVSLTDYFVFGVSKDSSNDYWLHAALWDLTNIPIGDSDNLDTRDGIVGVESVDSEWYSFIDKAVVCIAGVGNNGDNYWYTCDNRPTLTYVDTCMVYGNLGYDISLHEMNNIMYAHVASEITAQASSFNGINANSCTYITVGTANYLAVWADTQSSATAYVYYGNYNKNGHAGFDAYTFDGTNYTHKDAFNTPSPITDINGDRSTGTIYVARDDGYIGAYSFNGTTITELAVKKLANAEVIQGIHPGCSGYIYARTDDTLYKLTFNGSVFSLIDIKFFCDNCKRTQKHGLAADSKGIYNTGDDGYFCARTCEWNEFKYDLYDLPPWSECTVGCSIKNIKIFSRGKGTAVVPSDVRYKILISPSPPTYYQSTNQDVCDSYKKFKYGWAKNPLTTMNWEWVDLEDLEIGVGLLSSAMSYNMEETLKSDGAGHYTEWTAPTRSCACSPECDGTNWKHVNPNYWACCYSGLPSCHIIRDEAEATGNETYTYENGCGLGTVNNVTVLIKAKRGSFGDWSDNSYLRGMLRIGGNDYYSDKWDLETSYKWYSYTWNNNPAGGTWNWAAVNALEVGHNSYESSEGLNYYIEQVLVKVNYTYNDVVPEIRCTQTYAEVNYTCDVECVLNKPQQISINHVRNIKMLNFWDGSRKVYDLNRSGKSMVLSGAENGTSSCSTILCVRNMARDGAMITVSGLTPSYYNGDYRIKQFGWRKIGEKPKHYKWILALENAD